MSLNNIFQSLTHEVRIGEEARDAIVQHIDRTAEVMSAAHQTQAAALAELRKVIIDNAADRNAAIMAAIGEPEPKRLAAE